MVEKVVIKAGGRAEVANRRIAELLEKKFERKFKVMGGTMVSYLLDSDLWSYYIAVKEKHGNQWSVPPGLSCGVTNQEAVEVANFLGSMVEFRQ